MPSLNSWWWYFLENYIYFAPEPAPRKRTRIMDVICVDPPRPATESLHSSFWDMITHTTVET